MERRTGRKFRRHLGESFNEGARQLWLRMLESEMTIEDVTRAIGASRGPVSRWLYGDGRPGTMYAARLEEEFGIAVNLWHSEPVEAFAPPAAMAA